MLGPSDAAEAVRYLGIYTLHVLLLVLPLTFSKGTVISTTFSITRKLIHTFASHGE